MLDKKILLFMEEMAVEKEMVKVQKITICRMSEGDLNLLVLLKFKILKFLH